MRRGPKIALGICFAASLFMWLTAVPIGEIIRTWVTVGGVFLMVAAIARLAKWADKHWR